MAIIRNALTLAAFVAAGVIGFSPMAQAQLTGTCGEQMKFVQTEINVSTVQADKDAATAELAKAQAAAAANDDEGCKQHTNAAHMHVHH